MSEDTEQPGTEPAAGTPEAPVESSSSTPASSQVGPLGNGEVAPPPPPPQATPSSWSPPAGHDTEPSTPVIPVAIPFSYPPPSDPTVPGGQPGTARPGAGTPGRIRAWLPVALVAALVGGAIGA